MRKLILIISTALILASLVMTYIQLRCLALCIILLGLWISFCFLLDSVNSLNKSIRLISDSLNKFHESQKGLRDVVEDVLKLNNGLNDRLFTLSSFLRKKGLLNGLHETEGETAT